MTNATNDSRPVHNLYFVVDPGKGRRKRWIKVGAMFPHEDGDGFSVFIDAIPVGFDGNLVARQPKKDEAEESA